MGAQSIFACLVLRLGAAPALHVARPNAAPANATLAVDGCDGLARLHPNHTAFFCEETKAATVAGADPPTCSPVCGQQLDIVVVLGLAGDQPLTAVDVEHSRAVGEKLMEHFELGDQGSLFGFVDLSRGTEHMQVVSDLDKHRNLLTDALTSWQPILGGAPLSDEELQHIGEEPSLVAMLEHGRSGVDSMLLVLSGVKAKKNAESGAASSFIDIVAVKQHKASSTLPVVKLSLGLSAGDSADSASKLDWDVMEALLSTCPAVVLDPSLECGRMRWGSGGGKGLK